MLVDLLTAGDGGLNRTVYFLTGWEKLAARDLAAIGESRAQIVITQAGRDRYTPLTGSMVAPPARRPCR
ncbi:hypothetical protein [Phytohabitans rumicis]|uniref:Uncharacterized protein n=1 Tax=Phytohabitans rumicis TaxID=1076125 RepID=A0A6V8LGE1_9ACTN|nr:hypothetical protein [Phytohabitans rumicis]GFJ93147.1 hypothetical protein Prum_067890 [Phytohabitans rumicis]